MPAESKTRRGGGLGESLHLLVLAGFAVAQPLYDLLARHSGFFVVRRSEPADVLILAAALSLLLPGALAATLALVRSVHRGAGTAGHRLALAVLAAALALQAVKRLPGLGGAAAVAVAAALGAAAALAYHRLRAARLLLGLLTPAILLFPALFLLHPAVSKVVRPPRAAALAEVEIPSPAPILFVVFDALPLTSLMNGEGGIDPLRYPTFAGLAATSTWYRNATTVSGDTLYALPALLTGNAPDLEKLPSYYDHPRNLFTLLGRSHRLELFEHLTDLCPPELCPRAVPPLADRLRALAADLRVVYLHLLLPEELSASLPAISQAWGDFADVGETTRGKRDRYRKLALFLEAIDRRERPTLYFLHSLFPHAPYQHMPSGKRYTRVRQDLDPHVLRQGRWGDDPWPVRQSHRRHLLQVGLVDTLLGRILARFRELDLFDPSLIVVTADHGVSFRPGEMRRRPTAANFLDVMPVPLFVKRPGQTEGEIDDRNVESIDVLPTIAGVLGARLPWPTDGASAAGAAGRERPTKTCAGRPPLELPAAAFDARLEAVRRASELFGRGDFAGILRAGPHAELVDRRLAELPAAEDAGVAVRLADPALFSRVDPGSDFVPALIEGFAEVPPDLEHPLDLAVAVNGVVRAVTRTHLQALGQDRFAFSALVAEDAFRAGANDVEVLVVRAGPDGPRLARTARGAKRSLFAGMRLGVETVPGIGESGFHLPEPPGDPAFRWTDGAAKLVVPVDPGAPPTELRLDLAFTGRKDNELTVTLNGRRLFRGRLPPGSWSRTFDLEGVDWAGEAVLELESGTFVPSRRSPSPDRRTLGVAVAGVWLAGKTGAAPTSGGRPDGPASPR